MITLATLEQATAQQVFDQVVNHLRKQGVKSIRGNGSIRCLYRSPAGHKCAAGCLIADDEYKPAMEAFSWRGLVTHMDIPDAHSFLIQQLQSIHDNYPEDEWEAQFRKLSLDFYLTYTPPKKPQL